VGQNFSTFWDMSTFKVGNMPYPANIYSNHTFYRGSAAFESIFRITSHVATTPRKDSLIQGGGRNYWGCSKAILRTEAIRRRNRSKSRKASPRDCDPGTLHSILGNFPLLTFLVNRVLLPFGGLENLKLSGW